MNVVKKTFDRETSEQIRFGLGFQRWILLGLAFFLGIVSVYSINRVSDLLNKGPASVVAAPVEAAPVKLSPTGSERFQETSDE